MQTILAKDVKFKKNAGFKDLCKDKLFGMPLALMVFRN